MYDPSQLNSFSLTDLVAFIGCITGIVSLIISLRQVWLERFSLKIYFIEADNCFFDCLHEDHKRRTHLQGILHIRFSNHSSTPLTIYSIHIWINNNKVRPDHFDRKSFSITSYMDAYDNREILEFPMDKQISLPLRLEPYDAQEGYVFLPFFPDSDAVSEPVKVLIETTKGRRVKHSRIWCVTTIVDDGNGPFFQ